MSRKQKNRRYVKSLRSINRANLVAKRDEIKFEELNNPFITDWKRVRGQIEHEDDLINQRITWLITTNAFLFAAFFLSQKKDSVDSFLSLAKYFSVAIPIIGILFSVTYLTAIDAAMSQIKLINEWWKERKKSDPRNYKDDADDEFNLRHPQLIGTSSGERFDHNFMISKVIPSGMIFAWVVIITGVAVDFLRSQFSINLPVWVWLVLGGSLLMGIFLLVKKINDKN